jgi:hypothetical protein
MGSPVEETFLSDPKIEHELMKSDSNNSRIAHWENSFGVLKPPPDSLLKSPLNDNFPQVISQSFNDNNKKRDSIVTQNIQNINDGEMVMIPVQTV